MLASLHPVISENWSWNAGATQAYSQYATPPSEQHKMSETDAVDVLAPTSPGLTSSTPASTVGSPPEGAAAQSLQQRQVDDVPYYWPGIMYLPFQGLVPPILTGWGYPEQDPTGGVYWDRGNGTRWPGYGDQNMPQKNDEAHGGDWSVSSKAGFIGDAHQSFLPPVAGW